MVVTVRARDSCLEIARDGDAGIGVALQVAIALVIVSVRGRELVRAGEHVFLVCACSCECSRPNDKPPPKANKPLKLIEFRLPIGWGGTGLPK